MQKAAGGAGSPRPAGRHFASSEVSVHCDIWAAAGSGYAASVQIRCERDQRGRQVAARARPFCLCGMTNGFLKIELFVHVWSLQ